MMSHQGVGGQLTQWPQEIPLIQWFGGGVPPTRDHEICLWDIVGHRSPEETMAYVRGQVHDREAYPCDDGNANEQAKILQHRLEIFSRPVELSKMMTCLIVVISATAIPNPTSETVQKLKDLINRVTNLEMPNGKSSPPL